MRPVGAHIPTGSGSPHPTKGFHLMTATVRRTFTTLVFALVAALAMPMAAGATVPSSDGASTHEETAAPHDGGHDVDALNDEDPNTPGGDSGGWTEVEIPMPDPAVSDSLPEQSIPGVDDAPSVLDEDLEDAQADDAADLEAENEEALDELVEEGPLSTVAVKGPATHVAAGVWHSLFLDGEGQIWAWGRNTQGQLGNGTVVSSNVPVRVDMSGVLADADIVAVAAGREHSMALDAHGTVYTWGRNSEGALGDGTTTRRTTPVRVGGLLADVRVVQISGGGGPGLSAGVTTTSVALGENGRVYTWGSGVQGELGNGTTTARQTTPVIVGGLIANQRIVDLDAGEMTVVALSDTGQIYSWGYRMQGSMGNGVSGVGIQTVPVAVSMTGALSGVRIVQVQARHNGGAALSDDGQVFGWGLGSMGQLGNGSTADSTVPVRADMAALSAIGNTPVQVATGRFFVMALGEHGRVAAWGHGGVGSLGNGSSVSSSRAVEVSVAGVMGGANIIQIVAGSAGIHTLALSDDGRVFTWGLGTDGQLGNGANADSNVPVQVGGLRVLMPPADLVVTEGEEGVFSAASNEAEASVEWQASGDGGQTWSSIEGATAATYSTGPTSREMSGTLFRAVFTSATAFPNVVLSRAATLTVQEAQDPPTITLHPVERVRSLDGLEVTLTADAVSPTPMTVQWQSSTDHGDTWVDVPGANEKTYAFVATEDLHGVLFRAVFTNPSGTATTNNALLEVVLAAPGAHLTVTPQARHVAQLEPAQH